MSTLIVAARLPGELPLQSRRYPVAAHVCEDALDYWRALNRHWSCGLTLVNVEHDMECSDALLADLLACPHPLCTHAYRIYHPTTGERVPKWAHSVSLADIHPPIANVVHYTARGIEWACPSHDFADFSGIGFCKIAPEVRCAPLEEQAWPWVEMSVNAAVSSRWHIHWPGDRPGVAHRHE